MANCDDLEKLPLPRGWPKFAKRAVCVTLSLLKAAFDTELGRRLNCTTHQAQEHAENERLRLNSDSDCEVLRLVRARLGRMDPRKRTHYTRAEPLRMLEFDVRYLEGRKHRTCLPSHAAGEARA